jgi:hypothetical protein
MNHTLSIITVVCFDTERLIKTVASMDYSVTGFEHIFVIPKEDMKSIQFIVETQKQHSNVFMTHDLGLGIYEAMNLGAISASGQYLAFWNAGEQLISSDSLTGLIQFLRNISSAVVVSTWVDANGKHTPTMELVKNFLKNSAGGFLSHQAVFVRVGVFNSAGGFDTNFRVAADTKMLRSILRIPLPSFFVEPIVNVEPARFSSINHRKGRIEFLRILTATLFYSYSLVALLNFIKSELRFFVKKLS